MDERIIKIQHVLKKELDDNRYQHTLGMMSIINYHRRLDRNKYSE